MSNYADYFSKNRPKPKWFIGDRVYGKWNKIPFVGTILNDNMVSDEIGPVVSVYLDLPVKYKNSYKKILLVKQKDIVKLKEF